LTTTTALGFVAKSVDTTLRAQVCIGTRLEIVIVTTWRTGCVKVARWAWAIVAWTTVVKLAWRALTLRAVVGAWRAIAELFGALTIAWRAVTHTVTAHVAVGTRGATTFATLATTATPIAATASGFGVANALHHFTACGLGCSRHHIAAWGLA
jgi:hypothetical protein